MSLSEVLSDATGIKYKLDNTPAGATIDITVPPGQSIAVNKTTYKGGKSDVVGTVRLDEGWHFGFRTQRKTLRDGPFTSAASIGKTALSMLTYTWRRKQAAGEPSKFETFTNNSDEDKTITFKLPEGLSAALIPIKGFEENETPNRAIIAEKGAFFAGDIVNGRAHYIAPANWVYGIRGLQAKIATPKKTKLGQGRQRIEGDPDSVAIIVSPGSKMSTETVHTDKDGRDAKDGKAYAENWVAYSDNLRPTSSIGTKRFWTWRSFKGHGKAVDLKLMRRFEDFARGKTPTGFLVTQAPPPEFDPHAKPDSAVA